MLSSVVLTASLFTRPINNVKSLFEDVYFMSFVRQNIFARHAISSLKKYPWCIKSTHCFSLLHEYQ